MGKIIQWSLEHDQPTNLPHESTCFFYADNVVRYLKFQSTCSFRLCLENSVTYLSGNQRIKMNAGSYFTVNEGMELECLPSPPHTKAIVLNFTRSFLSDVARSIHFNDAHMLEKPEPNTFNLSFMDDLFSHPNRLSNSVQKLAISMVESGQNRSIASPDLFFTLAENLLGFHRQTKGQIDSINARQSHTRAELFRRVAAAREFMLDQPNATLSLDQVARYACLSPHHFHRTFREAFGESPMHWFRKVKLNQAKKMLESQSASEVAFQLGYADLMGFSKAFKRQWGFSPSALRSVDGEMSV